MNLHNEARAIAQEALEQDYDEAIDFIHESCDSHEVAIYYHKAIQFCAHHNTSEGEAWLEEIGGIAQPGDSFGQVACRIAFATLYCAAQEALQELLSEAA